MLKVDIKHSSTSLNGLSKKLKEIEDSDIPSFASHKVPVNKLKKQLSKYQKFKNIIVLANGGSRTTSFGIYESLARFNTKKIVKFVTTMEGDYLDELREKYSKKDTLIVIITKSGTNICPLEGMFYFLNYNYAVLPITSDDRGVLKEMCELQNKEYIIHPNIGGRYSGLTSCGIAPSILMGVDVNKILNGAKNMYKKCSPKVNIKNNPALKLAAALYQLDKKGYNEIFFPVYSKKLSGFIPLIIQLMHESVCKKRKGQTIFGDLAPESQHHTNQRFFGGKKNVLGLFAIVENQDDKISKVKIPSKLKKIKLRDGLLGDLNNIPLSKSLEFEFKGTFQDSIKNKIPSIVLSIERINEKTIGEFVAFWQYVAAYSAMLRNVNPFDQPQVEASKQISFKLRKKFKR